MKAGAADRLPVPAPALWLGAGAIALACHLVLVQQGLAAMAVRSTPPPPATIPEIEIMAVALSVAGQERVAELVKPVQSEAISAKSSAQTAERPASAAAKRLETAQSARVAAVAPSARPTTAAAAAAAPSVTAQKPESRAAETAAPKVSVAAVSGAIASAPRVSLSPSPAQTPRSGVARMAAASPAPKRPGLSPPTAAAGARVASPTAASPIIARSSAATTAPSARVASVAAPATSIAPVAKSAAPAVSERQTVAAVADAPRAAPAAGPAPTVDTHAPVPNAPALATPSLPPPAASVAKEGIAAPLPATAPQAPANETTYLSVLDVLAETPKGPCFAALPTLSDQSEFQLEAFALNETELGKFRTELESRLGRMPNTTMKQISDAQCAAMAFISDGPSYPRFKLFFEVDQRVIKSGEALIGRIGNTTGGFISFLLIDDEGIVQDLAFYLQFVPGGAKFNIPLSLTAGPVETQQLLMAISTPARLQTVIEANGAKAAEFFPLLAEELRARAQIEDVAIVAFSVK